MVRQKCEIGPCTLYLGDCLEGLSALPAGSIDCFITSPPYNLGGEPWPHLGNWKPGDGGSGSKSKWKNGSDACGGVQYGTHRDDMPWPEYVEWQQTFLRVAWELLPGDGAIFYNHKPRVIGAKLWTPMELIPPNVIMRQIVIWARPGGVNFNPTAFVPTHEWVMVLARDLFRLKSKAVSGLGDVWRMAPDKNPHPAPFPLELPLRVLDAVKGQTVCDPFMGSATTAVACIQSGRRFIGFESDRRHYEEGCRRVERAWKDKRSELPLDTRGPVTQAELFSECG